LHSLAKQNIGHKAIAVILSGAGFDGASGAAAIKASGGFVLAQTAESSEHQGMPSAVASKGVVDYICLPAEMPEIINRYTKNAEKNTLT
jgi:chemotaxis response regulator CheB